MATLQETSNFDWQNFFIAHLSSDITSSATDIFLDTIPTPSEGILVIDPDTPANSEVIFYNSKTSSKVTCPSAANGRGYDGSTAIAHLSGTKVIMAPVGDMFRYLRNILVTVSQNYFGLFDFVESGLVWSGDAYASTRNASMTSGVVWQGGQRLSISAVTAHSFTASKDTYIDILNTSGVGSVVYTEVANNAASPALAANSVRIGIVITGATNIASSASVNQGQETMLLPIASSTPYTVTDSLGNLICPRDPNRKVLGFRRITSNATTTSSSYAAITGLSVPVIVPSNRKVRVTVFHQGTQSNIASEGYQLGIFEGATLAALTTQISGTQITQPASSPSYWEVPAMAAVRTPGSSTVFYTAGWLQQGGHTLTMAADATDPAYILVELV